MTIGKQKRIIDLLKAHGGRMTYFGLLNHPVDVDASELEELYNNGVCTFETEHEQTFVVLINE